MATEAEFREAAKVRRIALSSRLQAAALPVASTIGKSRQRNPRGAARILRNHFRAAAEVGLLTTTVGELFDLFEIAESGGIVSVACPSGSVDFGRTGPALVRADGAQLRFRVKFGPGPTVVEYHFELQFSDGPAAFVRFDYDEADRENSGLGLKSHFHLSDDDGWSAIAPKFHPLEIADELLLRFQHNSGGRQRG